VKIQPVLFPPFVLLAPAYQVAPPVAVLRLIERKFALTIPLDLDRVCDAVVSLPIVTRLPDVPLMFQLFTVVVVPAVNRKLVG